MATAAISGRIQSDEVKRAIVTALSNVHSLLGRPAESTYQASLNSLDATGPVHQAEALSYLKLSGKSIGLLIDFSVVHLQRRHQTICEWHGLALVACVSSVVKLRKGELWLRQ